MLQDTLFTLSLEVARRIISVVDDLTMTLAGLRRQARPIPDLGTGVQFPSGARTLYGWMVTPSLPSITQKPAGVLILHGIGDKLIFWRSVQAMFAQYAIASLVFDYSGYGRSTGWPHQTALEQDAAAACTWFREQLGHDVPVYLLGYSLGTGLAAEIAPQLQPLPAGVILCQSYTSFRLAAERVLGPLRRMSVLVRDLWKTQETVCRCPVPLLLVHGERDILFPVAMAQEIYQAAAAAGVDATLALIPDCPHNGGYLEVAPEYWAPVLALIKRGGAVALDA